MQAKGAKFTANPKLVLTAGHAACECTRRVSVTFCYMMRSVKLRHRRDKSAGVGPANVTSRFITESSVSFSPNSESEHYQRSGFYRLGRSSHDC